MKLHTKLFTALLAALLAFSSVSVAAEPFVDDVVTIALWRMDEVVPSGSRHIVPDDTSVTGRPGTALIMGQNSPYDQTTYPTLTTDGGGLFGEALQFDSSQNQQAFRDGLWADLEGGQVQFWFKQDVGVTATQSPISVHNVFDIRVTEGSLTAHVWRNEGSPVSLSADYTQGEWTSVSMTIEGEFMELVVNGESQTRTLPSGMAVATGRLFVGRSPGGDGRYFDGLIDEMKISLTDYPEFYYPFEDAFGTFMLWHMNDLYETDTQIRTPDDDSANPGRDYDLMMIHNGGAVRPSEPELGPQLVDGFVSPSGADFGNALYFNGLNHTSRTTIAEDAYDLTNFRVEAWVKLDENINAYGANRRYTIAHNASRFKLYINDGANGWTINWSNWWDGGGHNMSRDYPNHKQWHHVAAEYYEGRRRLYLDGVLIFDRAAEHAAESVNEEGGEYIYIGSAALTSELFYGTIDEVRIAQAEPTDAPCGYWGYHPADLNQDCYVGIADLKILVSNWLKCSIPGDPDCEQFN